MKAKQSFNGSGVKADADEIQHVLIRAVVKAVLKPFVTFHQ